MHDKFLRLRHAGDERHTRGAVHGCKSHTTTGRIDPNLTWPVRSLTIHRLTVPRICAWSPLLRNTQHLLHKTVFNRNNPYDENS
jgi:hypothetical protein